VKDTTFSNAETDVLESRPDFLLNRPPRTANCLSLQQYPKSSVPLFRVLPCPVAEHNPGLLWKLPWWIFIFRVLGCQER
jgi:hypothetical protein